MFKKKIKFLKSVISLIIINLHILKFPHRPPLCTFMHLAEAFIQSDLQCIQAIHFFVSMCSLGIEPMTFALLTQCSTTEPQEQCCL